MHWLVQETPAGSPTAVFSEEGGNRLLLTYGMHADRSGRLTGLRVELGAERLAGPPQPSPPGQPLAWLPEEDQLLMQNWQEPALLHFVGGAQGEIVRTLPLPRAPLPWSAQRVGNDLWYLEVFQDDPRPSWGTLHRLNMATGADEVLFEPETGEVFHSFVPLPPGRTPERLAILAGRQEASPGSPTAVHVRGLGQVATAQTIVSGPNEHLAGLVPCSDGGFLFTVLASEGAPEEASVVEIRRWRTDGEIVTLHRSESSLFAWHCP